MTGVYSDKLLRAVSAGDEQLLGVRLGKLCVKANLPASYVAIALECSRMSIHTWFRGGGMRESKRRYVEALMRLIEKDMEEGLLPARSVSDAKKYFEAILGIKI